MAEFMGQKQAPVLDGFAAMGKPVPFWRRQIGHDHCIEMGLSSERAFTAVNAVSEALARDRPQEAMQEGMKYLDLTGTYRLFAVLLTAPNPQQGKEK